MCSRHDVCSERSGIYGTQGEAPHDPESSNGANYSFASNAKEEARIAAKMTQKV